MDSRHNTRTAPPEERPKEDQPPGSSSNSVWAMIARRWVPLAMVIIIGVAASILACRLIYDLERDHTRDAFEQIAEDRIRQLQKSIGDALLDMRSIHSLFTSSDQVTAKEFHTFATPLITDEPALVATLWAPRVTDSERTLFEALAGIKDLGGYAIREMGPEQTLVRRRWQAEYYPVLYTHPEALLAEQSGWDLLSDPARAAAMEKATRTSRLTSTAPLEMPSHDQDHAHGYLVLQPVYGRLPGGSVAAFSPANIAGFVGSLIDVGVLVEASLVGLTGLGVDLAIQDTDSDGEATLLWFHPGDGRAGELHAPRLRDTVLRLDQKVNFADRSWTVTVVASEAFESDHGPWVNLLVLSLGLVGTGVFALYALLLQNRTAQARRHNREMGEVLTQLRAEMDERTRVEDQLLQSQKMEAVGQLAGGIAHDFNNLLTAILGNTELLMAQRSDAGVGPNGSGPAEEHGEKRQVTEVPELAEIKQAGELAAALTQKLLTFSRPQPRQLKKLRLDHEVQGMKELLARVLGDHINLSIVGLDGGPVTPGDFAPVVELDPSHLHQVIMNLVINAGDAMPEGGSIILSVSVTSLDETSARERSDVAPGLYAVLQVSDTGHGMDEETLSRIFEPFFTTKEHGRGTGLGLATVYGIVKQSRGHIEVVSTKNQGTTFRVYFPVEEDGLLGSSAASGPGVTDIETPRSILVVEDNDAVRRLAVRILRNEGHDVWEAPDADRAIDLVTRGYVRPQLLLTDVMMPGMNGPELVHRLSRLTPDLRVIYMSGYTREVMPGDPAEDERSFLQKPFTAASLIGRVSSSFFDPPAEPTRLA